MVVDGAAMRIAMVAPSPDPFVVGGAEKLWWGMQRYINQETTHVCELFKIPVAERTVRDLIQAYHRFFTLDLSRFDRVISTKYPAFMVRHPDHRLYLQHLLRGCYDTYPLHLPRSLSRADADLSRVMAAIRRPDIGLGAIFDELLGFLERKADDPAIHRFPGPFIREVLHLLDRRAMEGIREFLAISQTVKNRCDYFPPAARVAVIHHPSNLTGLRTGGRRYLFTASRLDGPKRIDLLIRAFLKSRVDLPLLIAGTGPCETDLKKLAGGSPRIRFLGFVSDRDLAGYYADAAAVLFAPLNEDYGLVTLEAFGAGKPVVTCTDAGGPLELVVNGENGIIAKPEVASLAAAIEASLQMTAPEVGDHCQSAVREITWQRLMDRLLEAKKDAGGRRGEGRRGHAVVVSTYPVFPPMSGGQLRCYHVLRRLSCRYEISLLSLGGKTAQTRYIAPYFTEYVIPETLKFKWLRHKVEARLGISAADIAFMCHGETVGDYGAKFRELVSGADLVICAQPYAYPLVRRYFDGFLVYDAHNMEYLLKSAMVQRQDEALLEILFDIEKSLCQNANTTVVCTQEDLKKFVEIYDLANFDARVVPNGVDARNIPFLSLSDHLSYKRQMGIKEDLAIFIGSYHQPNIEAVEEIVAMAAKLPRMRFVIIGSVGSAFAAAGRGEPPSLRRLPDNLGFTGVVGDAEKEIYLKLADIALNPMRSGSGSNLKLAEYLAAGLPVVSTARGARGYDLACEDILELAELSEFVEKIKKISTLRDESRRMRARNCMLSTYDWDAIMRKYPVWDF